MDPTFHQTIANDFVSLHVLMEDVTTFLEKNGVDDGTVYLANLGIEELVTNTVKYGYDVPGTYMIEVMLKVDAEGVSLTIIDDGHPFNPVTHERKPVAEKIEDREIGGLGIHLLKKQFDRIEYRRDGGRNIVELRARRKVDQPTK
jgi:anti-sigma regulatory factor (Ser/Thr protein kinase)